MSGIESWSTTPANNNQSPPFGWPAGILPSQVEPIGRQMMTSLAAWYQAAEWINYNFTPTYVSATQFTLPGNVTPTFHVGRRVQGTDGSTSVYGTITVSAFTTLTTVTVVWDSGVLQTGVTIVYVGITSKTNTSAPSPAALTGPITVSATSGITLTVNGFTNQSIANFISAVGAAVSAPELSVQRAGSTANTIQQGPGVALNDTTGTTQTTLQHSGGQTELWQFNGGWTQQWRVTTAGIFQARDQSGTMQDVGWRDIPLNSFSANYTTIIGDRGKGMQAIAALTFTIAANASVPYPVGATLVFSNISGGNISIAINSDTMTLENTALTGTRTMANNTTARAFKTGATTWLIAGSGLT